MKSAIGPGRMKETDIIKGKDSPLNKEPSIYRFIDKETREINYVGQTNNIKRRTQEHTRNGEFNPNSQVVAFSNIKDSVNTDNLLHTEKKHISKHHPTDNKYIGGNGRK